MPPSAEPVTLLLVDDHPVVRDGLRGMFAASAEFEVRGEASGGRVVPALVERLDPDVVLMDLRMADGSGVSAIAELRRRGVRARILVLTTFDSDADVIPAIEAGATGYILKDAPRDELFDAVRATAQDRAVLSPSIAMLLAARVHRAQSSGGTEAGRPVSERERAVLAQLARGGTNREIARTLFISEATVKTHLNHLYAKLGAKDRAAAVARGYELGILT